MKRISSDTTSFSKAFSALWVGCMAIAPVFYLLANGGSEGLILTLVKLGLIWLTAYVLMRALVFDVADEVFDDGEHLIVRRGQQSERIAMSDIVEVSESVFVSPRRLTLRLTKAGNLGREITFVPALEFTLNPWSRTSTAVDLTRRVAAAQGRRADEPAREGR